MRCMHALSVVDRRVCCDKHAINLLRLAQPRQTSGLSRVLEATQNDGPGEPSELQIDTCEMASLQTWPERALVRAPLRTACLNTRTRANLDQRSCLGAPLLRHAPHRVLYRGLEHLLCQCREWQCLGKVALSTCHSVVERKEDCMLEVNQERTFAPTVIWRWIWRWSLPLQNWYKSSRAPRNAVRRNHSHAKAGEYPAEPALRRWKAFQRLPVG